VSGLDFVHVHQPAANGCTRTLLLLHGTGGNEQDLLPLAAMLDPSAGVLSPRGKVLEQGMPRFFRRLAEGVFDLEDLRRRAGELATFVAQSADHYGLRGDQIVAVGFSNGANIASAVLLLHPEALGGAILFRGMVPIVPDQPPALAHTPVFLSNGRQDPLVTVAETERLVMLLQAAGADVTLAWQPAGHQLTVGDVEEAKSWLSAVRA
jgi:predicted esterase